METIGNFRFFRRKILTLNTPNVHFGIRPPILPAGRYYARHDALFDLRAYSSVKGEQTSGVSKYFSAAMTIWYEYLYHHNSQSNAGNMWLSTYGAELSLWQLDRWDMHECKRYCVGGSVLYRPNWQITHPLLSGAS